MDICTITGGVFEIDGVTAKSGGTLKVRRVVKDGVLLSTKNLSIPIGTDGTVSFTLPRDCTAWIDGPVWGFEKRPNAGVAVTVPDAATADLEDLLPAVSAPSTAVSQAAFNAHVGAVADADTLGHVRVPDENIDPDTGLLIFPTVSQEVVQDYFSTFFNPTTAALHFDYNDAQNRVDVSADNATGAAAGLMSAADKTALDAVPSVYATQAALTTETTDRTAADTAEATARASGDSALTSSLETVSDAVSALDADLDAEATARANADTGEATARDAAIATASTADRARANHTGSQLAATISDFASAVAALIAAAVGVTVQAYSAALDAWAGKTAPAGTVVGTTDAQTLTNKTLTAPAISSPTGLVKADVGLGSVVNADTTTTANITDSTNKRFVTDAQSAVLGNTSGTNAGDQDLSGYVPTTRTVNGHALSANVSVTASDVGLGSVTNDAQAKADFSGYTGKTTPVDADTALINDSAASGAVKKLTWANLKATLKTYFDTLYQAALTFTGTGNVVKDTSPTITTPTIAVGSTTFKPSGLIHKNVTSAATAANTTQTTLWTYDIPANTLTEDGQAVRVTIVGLLGANGNTKSLRSKVAGTQLLGVNSTGNNVRFSHRLFIVRASSTQVVVIPEAVVPVTAFQAEVIQRITVTFSSTINIQFTGQNAVATAGDVTFETATVELLP